MPPGQVISSTEVLLMWISSKKGTTFPNIRPNILCETAIIAYSICGSQYRIEYISVNEHTYQQIML